MTKILASALFGGAILLAGSAHAAIVADIDFSEVSTSTTDPLIEGLQFSANDTLEFADTCVDDAQTPGNNYLLAGADDLNTNFTPYSEVGLINVDAGSGWGGANKQVTISFDAAVIGTLPAGDMGIQVDARLGNTVQGSASLGIDDEDVYHGLGIVLDDLGFDNLRIYGFSNTALLPFYIDDLTIDVVSTGTGAPAPATLGLMGLGMLGVMRFGKRRRSA